MGRRIVVGPALRPHDVPTGFTVWTRPLTWARFLLCVVIASHVPDLFSSAAEHDWGSVTADVGLMLLAAALMFAGRFIGVTVAIAGAEACLSLIIGDGYSALVGLILVAFAVGCLRRRIPIAATVTLFVAWGVAFVAMRPAALGDFVSPFTPAFGAALVLGVLVGQGVRADAQNATYAQEQAQKRRNERLDLARELHHSVARTMSMAKMHASLLAERQGVADAHRIEALCGESLEDLRRLMFTLANQVDDDGGLRSAVTPPPTDARDVVAECAQRLREVGHDVALTLPAAPVTGSPATAVARVVQEATSNILRHAVAATACVLSLTAEEGGVRLAVTNAASTHPRERPTGLGLPAVRERVEALGGTFDAGPVQGAWILDAYIPTVTDRVILPCEMDTAVLDDDETVSVETEPLDAPQTPDGTAVTPTALRPGPGAPPPHPEGDTADLDDSPRGCGTRSRAARSDPSQP